jgi:tetratricopeptide (TPR) repeat protein
MKRLLAAACAALLTVQSASAAPNPFKVSSELDEHIHAGLNALYNLKFDEAEKVFNSIKSEQEEHPMVAFGLTSVHWWRLSVYVLENDPQESEAFLKSVDECIRVSRAMVDRGDTTGEGYLCLGGAEGLLGRWQAANRKWMSAYFKGKGAYKHLRSALKVNPGMYDANMGLGIFDYYVATLPKFVRNLAFLGQTGDKQRGLDELQKAGTEGTYARTPSLLFLVNIYSSLENQPAKTFALLADLKKEYPKSPFIQMLTVVAMYNHRPVEELEAEAADFQSRVKDGTYPPAFETQADFAQGLGYFKKKDWENAARLFDAAGKAGTVKDPFFTWAALYKGYALDVLGRRDEAVAQYKEVLTHIRRWGAHDNAELRLKKPFTENEKELTKLIL